nr:MICOS complex subunit mic25-like [Chelonoidis abingdonii]
MAMRFRICHGYCGGSKTTVVTCGSSGTSPSSRPNAHYGDPLVPAMGRTFKALASCSLHTCLGDSFLIAITSARRVSSSGLLLVPPCTISQDEETEIKAKQLEEKDRELKKHDAYYKEQLARLEERSAQFYKVTTEQYQQAVKEVEAKFKRYESHPICADLQSKILQCYQQNSHETLSCSALASQYFHCVNHAKQSKQEAPGSSSKAEGRSSTWQCGEGQLNCLMQDVLVELDRSLM